MTIELTRLGPGELKFNPEHALKDFSMYLKNVEFKPEKPESETVETLSGDLITTGDKILKGVLSLTFAQDFDSDGLVAWTYANHGKTIPFTFHPVSNKAIHASGAATIVASNLGGIPGQVNDAQVDFEIPSFILITGEE